MRVTSCRLLLLLASFGWTGRAGAEEAEVEFRSHPECRQRLAGVVTVGIITPRAKVHEINAVGNAVLKADWSEQAGLNLARGLEAALRARGFQVKHVDPAAAGEEFRQVSLLYGAVSQAVFEATYSGRFPAKRARFDYSLGDLRPLLAEQGVDAILFAHAYGANVSAGRVILSAIAGVSVTGIDNVFLGLADKEGALLWFDAERSSRYNLRDAESVASFVSKAIERLPRPQP